MDLLNLNVMATVITLLPLVSCSNYYLITVPNNLRLQSDLRVAITNIGSLASGDRPLAIRATVSSDSNELTNDPPSFLASSSTTVSVGATTFLPIKIGNWPPGRYHLNVVGNGGAVIFNRTLNLGVNLKTSSLLIQTDKGVYQAGQTVKLRVISVDSTLLPFTNRSLVVFINDADGNRLKQWNTVVPSTGIFEGELPLSTEPVLGEWSIEANVLEISTKVNFTVTEFVSPRFIVTVTVPPFITFKTVDFPVTISAKTIHGQPVKGSFSLKFTKPSCAFPNINCNPSIVVRGEGSITVTIRTEDLNLGDNTDPWTAISVVGQVTEESTGIQASETETFPAYRNDRKLTVTVPREFKPTLTLTILIALTGPDGTPLADDDGSGTVEVLFTPQETKQTQKLIMDKDGRMTITVTPPEEATSLIVTADCGGLIGRGESQVAGSLSNRFISISVTPTTAKVGQPITVDVQSTFPMDRYISYQVTGRGSILSARTLPLNNSVTNTSFTLSITPNMAPDVAVIVYYITGCGEIVTDALTVTVDGNFQTPLTLKIDKSQTQPGNNVTLSIKTSSFTTVAISSVDQRLHLLDIGNEVTKSRIYSQLGKSETGDVHYDGSLGSAVNSSGLLMITNGAYYKTLQFNEHLHPPKILKRGVATHKPNALKTFFPSPWLWTTVTTNASGDASITLPAPYSNTSFAEWTITGFALHNKTGLDISAQLTNLTVSSDINLVANLPYQVMIGETVVIQVLVFNNLPRNIEISVTMTGIDGQDTANRLTQYYNLIDNSPTKRIKLNANEVGNVTFPIRMQMVGFLILEFKATSPFAAYTLRKPLRIQDEGVKQFFNKALLVDVRRQPIFKSVVEVDIPGSAINGTTGIQFDVIGNILANVLNNINSLVRVPTGCGEQNMINLVPSVVVLIFLKKINRVTPTIENLTTRNMEIGYQRQLTFRRSDGSFSAWGKRDPFGSTWLTAFVLKSFLLAQPFIAIDSNVISTAKQYIINLQDEGGSFTDIGRLLSSSIQVGANMSPVTLTAFVVIAFLETTKDIFRTTQTKAAGDDIYQANIDRAVTYLENNLDNVNEAYAITIVTYALQLASSRKANEAFQKMENMSTSEVNFKYWNYVLNGVRQSRSLNVEATSYALLVYTLRNEPLEKQLSIVTWLVANEASTGGFSSTQDTVVGIQALGSAGHNFVGADCSTVQMNVTYGTGRAQFDINRHTELNRQQQKLPDNVRQVNFTASGTGVAIAQVQWNYNARFKRSKNDAFELTAKVTPLQRNSKQINRYSIQVCSSYKRIGTSGMVILQLRTLSGFVWYELPKTSGVDGPQRVETANDNTLASVYFDSMTAQQVCVRLTATQTTVVSNLKSAYFSIYRYYNLDDRTDGSYNIPLAKQ